MNKVKSSNYFVNAIDYLIKFGDTECRLVVIGNSVDLAVNGTFLNSKKPYEPISSIPVWVWILTGISILGGMFWGGLICMMIGILMSTLALQFALQKKTGAAIGCFVGCCVLQGVIGLSLGFALATSGLY